VQPAHDGIGVLAVAFLQYRASFPCENAAIVTRTDVRVNAEGSFHRDDGKEKAEMSTKATGTFAIKTWDEQAYHESGDGAKMTAAHVSFLYDGAIEGESIMEYLMSYRPDGTGVYVGLERITGTVGGGAGSFVLQHTGTFASDGVTGTYLVVPESGTDDLRGLRGGGNLSISGAGPYPFALDYDVA
jgi:hypothetical protein